MRKPGPYTAPAGISAVEKWRTHSFFAFAAMSMSSELAAAIEEDDLHLESPKFRPQSRSADITVGQRMISACLGSFITSFVVTPFDVVRIRIQQQEVIPNPCCADGSTPVLQAARNTLKDARASVTKPSSPGIFWISQYYCGTTETCPRITSTFQGMSVIARNEGIRTLWRGLSLTLFMAIPSNIIYFTGYEYIRDRSPIAQHTLNPLVCGMLARTMAATTVAPVELLKTRLQSIPSEVRGEQPQQKIFSHLIKDAAQSFRARGVGSMFTGLQITLWRDVPFLGIYWLCYELFKDRIGRTLGVDFSALASQQDDLRVFSTSFLSGSISGMIAAFFTNPFDVGKTRLQIASETTGQRNITMFRFLYEILRREGLSALYGGFGARVMKIAPLCAIMISSYEITKKVFKDNL